MTPQHCCYYLPRNIDFIVHDPVRDLGGEVEDGVLVWLDGLGGVDDEDKGRVEDLAARPAPGLALPARLGAVLALAAHTPAQEAQYIACRLGA